MQTRARCESVLEGRGIRRRRNRCASLGGGIGASPLDVLRGVDGELQGLNLCVPLTGTWGTQMWGSTLSRCGWEAVSG